MTKPFGVKAVLAAAMVAVTVGGCSGGANAKAALPAADTTAAPNALGVKAIAPATQLDANVMQATGQLRSKQEAVLSSRASGPLTRVLAKVGDRVKKGQVLAQLDTDSLQIGVEQAAAARSAASALLDGATIDVERARKLATSGSLAQSGLDKAEVGFRQAQAQAAQAAAAYKNAQQMLRDASIVAPFDGVITARNKNVGDMVNNSASIFGIVDTEGLEVRVQVPESIIDRIQPGSIATGTLNPSGARFEAKVTNLGAIIDTQSRTVEVLADVVPGKAETTLRPGALVELDFAAAAAEGEDGKGLFLPAQAVSSKGQQGFVWVVQDGRVQKRDVKVQRVLPGYVRVVEGLTSQEQVVADASLPMKDGTAVRVVQ
ncbi:efflux RND transporter periplasmic adaptor subunit [Stigmatella sp. ncwal1]|uniref:Efflux RND transporter periplasmic adaptor subunit n=1 Tax=Stigmatella ashevillensis TaxID=2995309 RepID=A0ABT5D485_9BACT|nr:efflux RND transporter periplasmic adaptor subunit [Stigmatella ashevillena]MDC0707859.1 efflux RND transporter periplasmic adaptor subunit [Stigmatella ashevillena]